MADNPTPKQAPFLDIPKSSQTCDVSIIDSTCNIVTPPHLLVEPNIPGHEWLNLPTWTFHIKHRATGAQLLFDLGMRKDWQNSVPHIEGKYNEHKSRSRLIYTFLALIRCRLTFNSCRLGLQCFTRAQDRQGRHRNSKRGWRKTF